LTGSRLPPTTVAVATSGASRTLVVVGRKNSGKTHLVVRLVRELRGRGLAVSTIKHTHHHDIELDAPGKDSWRHREAGAGEVILASDRRWFLVHESAPGSPPDLDELLARLAPCDVALVEGYKSASTLPRLEVFRADAAATPAAVPLAAADPGIAALACPAHAGPAQWPPGLLRLDLDDTAAIADWLLAL
jgi:molybdopterin-guanine dinucleotide biosynthesis protein MobB